MGRLKLESKWKMIASESTKAVDDSPSRVLAFAYVKSEKREKIFLRVSPELKAAWFDMCKARKIEQNTAGAGLVEWWLNQYPEVQQMIVGATPPSPDLLKMVLSRFDAAARKNRGDSRMRIAATPMDPRKDK